MMNTITRESTLNWLLMMGVKNYQINPDLTVDVEGNVLLSFKSIKKIGVQFGRVTGDFNCSANGLGSLKGAPVWVGGRVQIDSNLLINLHHLPQHIGSHLNCAKNRLTNLVGIPKRLASLHAPENRLTTLKGLEGVNLEGSLSVYGNPLSEVDVLPESASEVLVSNGFEQCHREGSKIISVSLDVLRARLEQRVLQEEIKSAHKSGAFKI